MSKNNSDKSDDTEEIASTDDNKSNVSESNISSLTRRSTLAGITGLGLLGLASGSASAQSSDYFQSDTGNPNIAGILSSTWNVDAIKAETRSDADEVTTAIRAIADAQDARGMVINARNGDGNTFGVFSAVESADGDGIFARNFASSGQARGLVGRTDSTDGIALDGVAATQTGQNTGLRGVTNSDQGTGVLGQANASSGTNYGVRGTVNSPDGYSLFGEGDAKIEGDLEVTGTKHFVQAVETPKGTKEVSYTAVESGTPRTETSDVAEMSDGRAEIDLPEHFEMVTSEDEPLNVQITPYAKEKVQPQVVEHAPDHIVVEDFSETTEDYTFAYTVKGTREGFEDEEIVRDP